MDILFLNEQRCKCGKLLLKGVFFDGILEIKCKRCGEVNKIGTVNLVNDATHHLLMVDKQGTIINGSAAAGYVLGYTCDELIGKNLSQIIPIAQKELVENFFSPGSELNEDNYLRLDAWQQSKSGKKIFITAILKLYRPSPKEKYLLISAEPKNIESKNNFLRKNVSEFPDSACNFYFIFDKKGMFEYISPPAEENFEFFKKAFVGKNYFDCLPAETRLKAQKIFNFFSINGESYRVAGDIGLGENIQAICDEIYFTPNFNDMGKLVGYRASSWLKRRKTVKS